MVAVICQNTIFLQIVVFFYTVGEAIADDCQEYCPVKPTTSQENKITTREERKESIVSRTNVFKITNRSRNCNIMGVIRKY